MTTRTRPLRIPTPSPRLPKPKAPVTPPEPQQTAPIADILHTHKPRPHASKNANITHKEEHENAGINIKIALWLTTHVGTMQTAYLFLVIGIGSLVGYITNNYLLAVLCGGISSYLLQLVLLPIIMVGQGVQGRKAEIQADETYHFAENTYHDTEQSIQHLNAQDVELLKQTGMLQQMLQTMLSHDAHAADITALHAKIDALHSHVSDEIDAHAVLAANIMTQQQKPASAPKPRTRKKPVPQEEPS